jgi:lipoic acid synthetase
MQEPIHLAQTHRQVAPEVCGHYHADRDDLRDGGARHFVDCIDKVRELSP